MAKAEDSPEFVSALEDLETIIGDWKGRCAEATARAGDCLTDFQARVAPDERALRDLLEPPAVKNFGGVTLYPNRIVMNGVVRQLSPGMKTVAETRGNINRAKRSLLTRSAVGVATFPISFGLGFFATPKTKKHDDREVVLIVEGSDWAEMATYSPALQRDVVRFAKEIETTAEEWAAGQSERLPKAAAVAQRIRDVHENSAELNAALDALESVRSEQAPQEALDRVQARIGDDDLKVSRDTRKRIEAAQSEVADLSVAPPTAEAQGTDWWRPSLTIAALKTESMGLLFRRSANDVGRSLGRWQSNPASGPAGGGNMPLEDLLVIAETAQVPIAPGTAGPLPPPAAIPPSSGGDTVEALGRLAEMRTAGLLTDEEFAAAKARLLAT